MKTALTTPSRHERLETDMRKPRCLRPPRGLERLDLSQVLKRPSNIIPADAEVALPSLVDREIKDPLIGRFHPLQFQIDCHRRGCRNRR